MYLSVNNPKRPIPISTNGSHCIGFENMSKSTHADKHARTFTSRFAKKP